MNTTLNPRKVDLAYRRIKLMDDRDFNTLMQIYPNSPTRLNMALSKNSTAIRLFISECKRAGFISWDDTVNHQLIKKCKDGVKEFNQKVFKRSRKKLGAEEQICKEI